MSLLAPDGSRKFWDLELNRERGTIPPRRGQIRFAGDGKTAVTFRPWQDRFISLWDIETGQLRETVCLNEDISASVLAVAFAPDGHSMAVGHQLNLLGIYRFATHEWTSLRVAEGPFDLVKAVAFDAEGQNLAVESGTGLVLVLNPKSREIRCCLEGHSGPITHMTFSPDGRTLATASDDRTVRFWDPATGQERLTLRVDKSLARLAFTPDGRTLAGGVPIQVWRGVGPSDDGVPN
jgi:WD40 repeat protein